MAHSLTHSLEYQIIQNCRQLAVTYWDCGWQIRFCCDVLLLLQEGVSPREMDKKTKAMGFPVGSATLIDEVGIDVAAHITDYLSGAFGSRFGFGASEVSLLKDMVAQGYLGTYAECVALCRLLDDTQQYISCVIYFTMSVIIREPQRCDVCHIMSIMSVLSFASVFLRIPLLDHILDENSCKHFFDFHLFLFPVFNYNFIMYTYFTHLHLGALYLMVSPRIFNTNLLTAASFTL